MKINGKTKAFDECSEMRLRENARDQSSENIAGPPFGHARIPGGVDVDIPIGSRNHGSISFEHEVGIPSRCELRRDVHAIRCYIVDTLIDKTRHLSGMRRQYGPAQIAFKSDERI